MLRNFIIIMDNNIFKFTLLILIMCRFSSAFLKYVFAIIVIVGGTELARK